jgi:TonB family protein
MSYKSLLFCPDERTARLVTQVLKELEFAVESANEPFAAVKELEVERFDALIVDCQNEQDASLLFKTARNSSQNHSSLSVAVVEGQAGVAKAFRIGANLVLTKPINVEQSKGTLRVARGLLRKSDTKAPPPSASAKPFLEVPAASQPTRSEFSSESVATKGSSGAVNTPEAPFSALEVEPEPQPETEAAEVAVLESLPQLPSAATEQSGISVARAEAQPIAAGTSGHAAAVAPALEKSEPVAALNPSLMPPMVTNEPIVVENRVGEGVHYIADAPAFSTLERPQQGGGARFLKIAVLVLVAGAAVYLGWQKLQPLQYLQRIRAAHTSSPPEIPATPQQVPAATAEPSPAPVPPAQEPSVQLAPEDEISASQPAGSRHRDNPDSIEIQELPMSRDKNVAIKPQPVPFLVKPDTASRKTGKAPPAPPPVQVSAINPSSSAIESLATPTAAIPTLAPASLRVSQGVSQGLILKKVPPAYPSMALQLRKEGTVELLATISKQGVITNVKVISGDAMLARPAADAVRQWKYRPYLLNGEPVEIQTQITINFKVPR